jgi:hypothetical protein
MTTYWSEHDVYEAARRSILESNNTPTKELLAYLNSFKQDELSTGKPERLPNFDEQYEKLVEAMRRNFSKQGYRQVVSGNGVDVNIPNFWEVVLVMNFLTKEIEIMSNLGSSKRVIESGIYIPRETPYVEFKIIDERLKQVISAEAYQQNKESIIPLSDNQEKYIAKDKVKYQLTYNSTERILRLNNVQIAKTQYGSENDMFIKFFVTEHNTGEHSIAEILEFMGKKKLTKKLSQIFADIRITGDIKTVFFPISSVNGVEFRNPITHTYAKEHKLPEIDTDSLAEMGRNGQK